MKRADRILGAALLVVAAAGMAMLAVVALRPTGDGNTDLDRAESRQLIPYEIGANVRLGMTVEELLTARPGIHGWQELQEADLQSVPDFSVAEFLPANGLWEGVMYNFENGRLVSLSLVRGGIRTEGTWEAIQEAVRLAIAQFGKDFEKRVVLAPGDNGYFLCPLLCWTTPERNLFLSFGRHTRASGAEVNRLRLTVAAKDKATHELFALPGHYKLRAEEKAVGAIPDKDAVERFLGSDFDRLLGEALGTQVEGEPGAVAEPAQELARPAASAADPPRGASRPEGEEPHLRRRSSLAYVVVGAGAVIVAAGAWLILRRRAGRRTA